MAPPASLLRSLPDCPWEMACCALLLLLLLLLLLRGRWGVHVWVQQVSGAAVARDGARGTRQSARCVKVDMELTAGCLLRILTRMTIT